VRLRVGVGCAGVAVVPDAAAGEVRTTAGQGCDTAGAMGAALDAVGPIVI